MKYTPVVLATFVSMAAAIPMGEMDRTLGNVNDAAVEREHFPMADSLRSDRLPIADTLGDKSGTGSIMEIPIVTLDRIKIHQRDEHFRGKQKLPLPPMEEANFRQPNQRYERENKLLDNSVEEAKVHQRHENYKGEDMRNEDSIPSRLSTLKESA